LIRRLAIGAALAALTACTVGPNYRRPVVAIPDQFYGSTAPADAASLADVPWFDLFGDPTLRSLIDEALRDGFDARIAAARVEQARARYGIAGSQRFPEIEYAAGYLYGHTSKFATPSDVTGGVIVANVNANWEIDLWGRIRRLSEAARADYLATEEARRGVLLSLISEVAAAYFDLRELDAELDIARRNTAAFQNTADLFRRRLEGGTASGLDTARAEALLATERRERKSDHSSSRTCSRTGRARAVARSAAAPSVRARRSPVGVALAATGRTPGRATTGCRERRNRRCRSGLLSGAEPHRFVRRAKPGARKSPRQRQNVEHSRESARADLQRGAAARPATARGRAVR
jgi:hypothetical protein